MGEIRREVISQVRAYRLDVGRSRARPARWMLRSRQAEKITKMKLSRKVWLVKELEIVARTRTVKLSHWANWWKLYDIWGVETLYFGEMGARTEAEVGMQLKNELQIL